MDTNTFEYQTPTQEAAAPAQTEKPVGTGIFFGLELLLSLPLIGLIAAIIFSFVPQNTSLKHYARAKMLWSLISLLLTVLLVVSAVMTTKAYIRRIEEEFGLDLSNGVHIEDLLGQLEGFDEISNIVGQIGGIEGIKEIIEDAGGLEAIGELIGDNVNIENIGEFIEDVGGIENVEEIINEIGGIENIGKIAEQFRDVENIDKIVGEVSSIDHIDEVITEVGGIDKISEIDSIEDVMTLAAEIKDPEVKEQVWDIIRQYIDG